MIKKYFLSALLLLLYSSLLQAVPASDSDSLKKRSFEIDGLTRTYYLHLPENLAKEAPLVLALHGYGGTAKGMIDFSKMNEVADQHNFAVCYPQGFKGKDDKNSWNAGYSNPEINDVNFLASLAQYLQKEFNLNPGKTFSTGMSNGADMCYVLACQRPDVFAAVAPVAGCMMKATFEACTSANPVPIFEIHGTKDEITLWNGDPDYLPGSGGYLGTAEIMDFWKKKNGCTATIRDTLADTDPDDGSFVVSEKHSSAGNKNEVWLYTLVDGKHDWPGSWGNKDFQASKEIWQFFKRVSASRGTLPRPKDRSHLAFFGSSVCKGTGAENNEGYAWQFYHNGAMDTTRYAYFNASTGGDNTLKVEQEERLTEKLYPTDPDIVVIGLSLSNEGIQRPHTDAGRVTIVEQFRSRLEAMADSLDRKGIQVVIANCYAHSFFQPTQYVATQQMNRVINTWKYPSINLLGTIDNGKGGWVEGYARDPGHPNRAGHHEMSLAIVPSLFDAIKQGKKTPAYDWNKSFTTIENPQAAEVIYFDVEQEMHSFSMSFRFKNAASGVIARIHTELGIRQVKIDDYRISYGTIASTFPKHTGAWNHVVISHNYANQKTIFALNGEVLGEMNERIIPTRFVYGGTLEAVDLKDLSLHRSSLNPSEIADLNNKLFIQSSLEVYSPLTKPIDTDQLPNQAQSLTAFRRSPGVMVKWMEKRHY